MYRLSRPNDKAHTLVECLRAGAHLHGARNRYECLLVGVVRTRIAAKEAALPLLLGNLFDW